MNVTSVVVRPLTDDDRPALHALLEDAWGLPVVSISGVHPDPSTLPGFVAEDGAGAAGFVTYLIDDDDCEVLTINSIGEGRGVGQALMNAARTAATDADCSRLWLITSNDNLRAISFYQRWGMDLIALHRNFADTVRAAKPDVDTTSPAGIEFRHALEFELLLP